MLVTFAFVFGGIVGAEIAKRNVWEKAHAAAVMHNYIEMRTLIDQVELLEKGEIENAKNGFESHLDVKIIEFGLNANRVGTVGEISRDGLKRAALHRDKSGYVPTDPTIRQNVKNALALAR